MLPERPEHQRQPQAPSAPRPWPPEDNDDWERVLDCGAPGPIHAEPALFYQPGRPAGQPPRSQNA
jgi:hypothetical protein